MSKITNNDLRAALQCVHELYAETNIDSFPQRIIDLVTQVLPADVMAYSEVDLVGDQSRGLLSPVDGWDGALASQALQRNVHQHPVIQHTVQTGDNSARKISDFLTRDQFHSLELYQELFRPMGIEDQLSIGLTSGRRLLVGLAFNRGKTPFTERDREILTLLRPHLSQAYYNAREMSWLRKATNDSGGGLAVCDQLPFGLIAIDSLGRIQWISGPARKLIDTYFPRETAASRGAISQELREWLGESTLKGELKTVASVPYVAQRAGHRLQVRACKGADGATVLILEEQVETRSPAEAMENLGLTRREADVMWLVMEGKTNPQVAQLLGISRRTVQKHMEHIFLKLGVETRSSACMRVVEAKNRGR